MLKLIITHKFKKRYERIWFKIENIYIIKKTICVEIKVIYKEIQWELKF
jgi:hypothetical protein